MLTQWSKVGVRSILKAHWQDRSRSGVGMTHSTDSANSGRIPDLAMPGGDGYSLARRIRALPETDGGKTLAIALSAIMDPELSLVAGFDLHLMKPVDPVRLVTAVHQLVRHGGLVELP